MPFDIGETINAAADAFLRAPMVNTIARNPVYTALMITFIIMLIILFMFRDADTEESLLVMSLRGGFWVFLTMLGILFLHNKVLMQAAAGDKQSNEFAGIFNGGYGGAMPRDTLEDSVVPVHINAVFN
jgi:O-antigen ligase